MRYLLSCFIFLASFLSADNTCEIDSKVIIIRHGEAENNVQNIYNSNPSSPKYKPIALTDKGKQEAQETANKLLKEGFNDKNIAAVFVSPLPRTVQTAQILADSGLFSKDKIKIDPKLIEEQAGDLEGKPRLKRLTTDDREKYHYESEFQFQERVKDFYKSLLDKNLCGNILVVTHRGVAQKLADVISLKEGTLKTGQAIVLPLKPKPQP